MAVCGWMRGGLVCAAYDKCPHRVRFRMCCPEANDTSQLNCSFALSSFALLSRPLDLSSRAERVCGKIYSLPAHGERNLLAFLGALKFPELLSLSLDISGCK